MHIPIFSLLHNSSLHALLPKAIPDIRLPFSRVVLSLLKQYPVWLINVQRRHSPISDRLWYRFRVPVLRRIPPEVQHID